jgi:hypothetical protein
MASQTFKPNNEHPVVCPNRLESAARAAFDVRAERKLTDAEWAAMRHRLLEFARILRAWERKTTGVSKR